MKKLLTLLCLTAWTAFGATKYWDINGATAGAGGATPSGNWDTTTANWTTSSAGGTAGTTWAANDDAIFSAGTDATGIFTVTTTAAQTANSLTIEEGTVQHSGTSANTLTTANLTINSGATFSVNVAVSFTPPVSSTCTLNGGTIQNRNGGVGSSFLTSSSANSNMKINLGTGGGHVSVTGASGISIYTGLISGTGPLTIDGNGTFRLTTTTATYSGATIINGKLQLSTTANVLPSGTDMTINSGGTFDDEASQTIASLSGSGTLSFLSSPTLTCGSATSTTFSGPVSGAGTFTKVGTGTLTISGNDWANTGNVNINAGTIKYGNSAAGLGSSSTVVIASGATLDMNSFNDTFGGLSGAGSVINNSGTTGLHVGINNVANTFSGVISGTAGVEKQGTANLTLSGANTYSGKTVVTGGTLTINTSGDSCLGAAPASFVADQLTLGAGTTFALGSAANTTLSANRGISLGGAVTINLTSKDLTVPAVISGVGGSFTKSGGNALILSGANTFSGGVTLSGGTLTVNNSSALGSGTVTITPAGICTIAGKSGTTVLANPITVNAGGGQVIDFFATTGNALTLNGQISGSANISRGNGGGAGTVTINGNNSTYTGTLTLQQGPLVLGHKNALGTGTFVVTPGSVAISLGANTALTGANAVANNITLNGTLPVSTTSDLELAGVLSGASGALTKSGTGTLILSGANTYAGDTTVNAGTLALSGSGSVSSANLAVNATLDVTGHSGSSYTLLSGQTLKGTGTVLGQIVVNGGATVAPGNPSIGTLTLAVPPTVNGSLAMDLTNSIAGGTGADKIVLSSGTLSYGGNLTVTLLPGSDPLAGGEVFDLFDAASFGGSFLATNLPPLGAGLNWWTDKLYSDGTITVNRAPVAADQSYSRGKGLTLKIAKADLVATATDADISSGDVISYNALTSSGSQGATITEDGNFIFYEPANDNNDTLQFTVKDARGGVSMPKNIQITVVAGTGQAQTISVSGSTATVSFAGIPGISYQVQRSTNMVDWAVLETTNAPANGVFDFTDDFNDLGVPPDPVPSAAYYRLAQP